MFTNIICMYIYNFHALIVFHFISTESNSKEPDRLWYTNSRRDGLLGKFEICASRFSRQKLHVSLIKYKFTINPLIPDDAWRHHQVNFVILKGMEIFVILNGMVTSTCHSFLQTTIDFFLV